MPAPSTNRSVDLPSSDPFDPSTVEDIPKTRSRSEKKRKKYEATLASDQASKEKASTDIERDAFVKIRDCPSSSRFDNSLRTLAEFGPSLSANPSSATTQHAITSPVFAALGEAFRGKPLPAACSPPLESTRNPSVAPAPVDPPLDFVNSLDESPPRPALSAAPIHEEVRGGFSSQSPSTSPRQAYRLPARRTSGYQALADPLAASPRGRPVSMPSQFYSIPTPSALNLNQLRGARDIDTDLDISRSTSRKGGHGDYMSLDSFALAGDDATSSVENALLVSSGNSLHIFKVDKDRIGHLGCIEGLRGNVVAAKVLPCTVKQDVLRQLRPLIAVIVHGPLLPESQSRRGSVHSSAADLDPPTPSMQPTRTSIQFQTTVEVYSLRSRTHVSTLYLSPAADAEATYGRQVYESPPPVGALNIYARGRFVVVASGVSGEVYIYDAGSSTTVPFRCIGKTWTSVPQRKVRTWSSSSASSEADSNRERSPTRQLRPEVALVSLSNRWLTYVPPVPPSRSTMFGKVNTPHSSKGPPGLSSHTAPSQPQTTCEIDTPFEESRVNRVARDVTQEMLKGARWVGDQGKQAWKSYWNKSPETTPYEPMAQGAVHQFPPTHASNDQSRISQQPTVVSILDLENLAENQDAKPQLALQPAATFSLPGGCSFLSINPSGLSLLTANSKGDVQYVWDLMQMTHARNSSLLSSKFESTPIVRQVARFTRVTVANVVEVLWLEPRGDRLAVVTDRGTVHLHDLPYSALMWPPPTKVQLQAEQEDPKSEASTAPSSSSGWNSAFSAVSGGIAAVRSNTLMGLGNFNLAQASAGVGARGTKMMASGFSKSVEAAAGLGNTLIHMGETRLHVPGPSRNANLGCARWWTGKEAAIGVCGNGSVRVYRILFRTEKTKNGKKKAHSVVGERQLDLTIPDVNKLLKHTDEILPNDGFNVAISWPSLAHASRPSSLGPISSFNPLSFAEINSCTPYQPFHMDRRVGMYAYTDASNKHGPYDKWIFGEDIPTRLVQDRKSTDSDIVSLEEKTVEDHVATALVPNQARSFAEEPKAESPLPLEDQEQTLLVADQPEIPKDLAITSEGLLDFAVEAPRSSGEGDSSSASKDKKKGKGKKRKGKSVASEPKDVEPEPSPGVEGLIPGFEAFALNEEENMNHLDPWRAATRQQSSSARDPRPTPASFKRTEDVTSDPKHDPYEELWEENFAEAAPDEDDDKW